jgi:hypothetical protein
MRQISARQHRTIDARKALSRYQVEIRAARGAGTFDDPFRDALDFRVKAHVALQ